jgi:hypothetical protein
MTVLPHTGASRYHNCCMEGGTSPKYFGFTIESGLENFSDIDSAYRYITSLLAHKTFVFIPYYQISEIIFFLSNFEKRFLLGR